MLSKSGLNAAFNPKFYENTEDRWVKLRTNEKKKKEKAMTLNYLCEHGGPSDGWTLIESSGQKPRDKWYWGLDAVWGWNWRGGWRGGGLGLSVCTGGCHSTVYAFSFFSSSLLYSLSNPQNTTDIRSPPPFYPLTFPRTVHKIKKIPFLVSSIAHIMNDILFSPHPSAFSFIVFISPLQESHSSAGITWLKH